VRICCLSIVVGFLLAPLHPSCAEMEFNTSIMQSTFKIQGKGSTGTAFLLSKKSATLAGKHHPVLITANHVLADMKGETATLILRKRVGKDKWKRDPTTIQIRAGKTNLWAKHPEVDLAAIWFDPPPGVIREFSTIDRLIVDITIEKYEIHPGDTLFCLGYPFTSEANAEGFPILRTGAIASYPLTPTKKRKVFLYDFCVFRGNSGGPVYMVDKNRYYAGSFHVSEVFHGLIGVVSKERKLTEKLNLQFERREIDTPLSVAEVIHASFIKELVDSMPEPSVKSNRLAGTDP